MTVRSVAAEHSHPSQSVFPRPSLAEPSFFARLVFLAFRHWLPFHSRTFLF